MVPTTVVGEKRKKGTRFLPQRTQWAVLHCPFTDSLKRPKALAPSQPSSVRVGKGGSLRQLKLSLSSLLFSPAPATPQPQRSQWVWVDMASGVLIMYVPQRNKKAKVHYYSASIMTTLPSHEKIWPQDDNPKTSFYVFRENLWRSFSHRAHKFKLPAIDYPATPLVPVKCSS